MTPDIKATPLKSPTRLLRLTVKIQIGGCILDSNMSFQVHPVKLQFHRIQASIELNSTFPYQRQLGLRTTSPFCIHLTTQAPFQYP
jgi:hypothetical protein